jgi:hypothetical protein
MKYRREYKIDFRDSDTWLIIGMAVLGILFVLASVAKIVHMVRHNRYLAEHGCQLLIETPTGRSWPDGKSSMHIEKVYVYECVDGVRSEVR